jgi:tetratricopeptide (TPR) repeat protein
MAKGSRRGQSQARNAPQCADTFGGVDAAARVDAAATEAGGHLPIAVLVNLLAAPRDSDEGVALRHVLALCPDCRCRCERLRDEARELRHWNLAAVLPEAEQAPGLWARIEALAYQRQLSLVGADESFQTWGFCRFLEQLSGSMAAGEPQRAAQLANLALVVADALGPAYDEDWIEDLAALALAHLGDARRELGELRGSNDAFDLARRRWARGTESPSVEAEILAREALLRRDEHRLEEAIGLFGRVHEICSEKDDTEEDALDLRQAGAARVQQAWCHYHLGRADEALARLAEAESLLDGDRDAGLLLALRCGQVHSFLRLGCLEEAAAAVIDATQRARALGATAVRLRLRLAEARLTDVASAERKLWGVARAFLRLDRGVDAALAFMELAARFVREGALEKLPRLASELFPVWSSPEIGRVENAGLLVLQNACGEQRVTAELVRSVASLLEGERRPSLDWWSTWGTVLR